MTINGQPVEDTIYFDRQSPIFKFAEFTLDSKGDVIVSGKETGVFAVNKLQFDVRSVKDADIFEAAKRMTAGKTGVTSIKIDNEEYYLAFVPMPSSRWSRATVLAPAKAARTAMLKQMNTFRDNISQLFVNIFIGAVVLFSLLLACVKFPTAIWIKKLTYKLLCRTIFLLTVAQILTFL